MLHAFFPMPTFPDPLSDRAVSQAVAMARLLGAEIHAASFALDVPAMRGALSRLVLDVPELARSAETKSAQEASRLEETLRAAADEAGITVSVERIRCVDAATGDRAAEQARYFDLSILPMDPGTDADGAITEAIVFGSGRPAILVSEEDLPESIGHVAIAWDGSRVAARALADAMPLLGGRRVSILTVVNEKPIRDPETGVKLAAALARKGIEAATVAIELEDRPVSETLQDHACQRGAEILVMGGYGHSRLRDFVLGGATKGVLRATHLPVFISH